MPIFFHSSRDSSKPGVQWGGNAATNAPSLFKFLQFAWPDCSKAFPLQWEKQNCGCPEDENEDDDEDDDDDDDDDDELCPLMRAVVFGVL
ncbi:hypothetical protein TURU_027752 [Turdus rufiventris]|nr:hypothetical protein TURU_027752 [Turdus rufiventris]